jgi:hypothetical protein
VLVWAVLIIRKALIIVAAVFAPVAFGGAPADATRSWVRKWVEFTVAMVFSKLVVVLIFVIALSLLTQSGGGWHGLSNLMTGLLLLMLASFSPWMVFKLVHFVGGDIAAAHHSALMSDTKVAAGSAVAMTAQAKGSAQKVFASRGGTTAAAGSAAAGSAAGGSTAFSAGPVGAAAAAGGAAWRAAAAPGRAAGAAAENAAGASATSGSKPAADAPPTQPPATAPPSQPARPEPPRSRSRLSYRGIDWSEAT